MKGENGPVSRRFRFVKTHQGPLVAVRDGKPIAIRLAKLTDNGAIDQGYAMGRAKSVAEFKEAMRPCNMPMFNAMVADTGGNIYYVYNGAVPRRSTKFDWTKPVDGANPDTDWQGYLRYEELPQIENPKCGFLQNCNQSPLATTPFGRELRAGEVDENPKANEFPAYVMATERERDNPRAQISRRILHSEEQFDYDEWTRDGFNTKILEAELRIPELVKEWGTVQSKEPDRAARLKEPVEMLKAWNCVSGVDSVAMTLFVDAYDRAMKMIAKRDVLNYPRIRALEATLAELEKTHGTWKVTWGEINRLQRIHGSKIDTQGRGAFSDDQPSLPIAGAPGPLGVVFNFYTVPQAGQKRRYGVAGHSFVGAVELSPEPKVKTILQFGESGDPGSPHWFDQAVLYAKKQFKPSWYTRADVEAHSDAVTIRESKARSGVVSSGPLIESTVRTGIRIASSGHLCPTPASWHASCCSVPCSLLKQPDFESNLMPRSHSIMLLNIAPLVAETFRTDPDVDELLEPAVFVGVAEDACAAAVVERIQLTEAMCGVKCTEAPPVGGQSASGAPIAVLVMDEQSATVYHVADPRVDPKLWPWTGPEGDDIGDS